MKALRFLITTIFLLAELTLIGSSVLTSSRTIYSSHYLPFYRLMLACLSLIILVIYIGYAKVRPLRASGVHRDFFQLPPGRAIALQNRVGRTRAVTPRDAQIFALAITSPVSLRPRIKEIYEPSRRTIKQDVTVAIQLPRALFKSAKISADGIDPVNENLEVAETLLVPFPVVVPIKGELADELEVYGVDEDHLTTYSYSEYLDLVAGVLRMLLLKSCRLGQNQSLDPAITKAELGALRCIMRRGLQSAEEVKKTVGCLLNLKTLDIPDDEGHVCRPDEQMINLVAELVRQLANRYAVVALITCNSEYRSLIHYTRTIVPGLKLSNFGRHSWSWAKERLSIVLGARPVSVLIPLTMAATCQSYHLVARCPEGLYLRIQRFHGLDEYLDADEERRKDLQHKNLPVPLPPYYHARSRLGQPYAHFYSRYFAEPPDSVRVNGETRFQPQREFPSAEFIFEEVPPGSLFRSTLAASSAFALIWIVGYIVSRGLDPGTDAPAVLLAFPAILAGWLGVDALPRQLLEGTLVARLSLVCTAIFALAGSGLFMIYRARVPVLHGPIPFLNHISIMGIGQGSWGVLVTLSFINSVYATYRWLRHTWEYKALCARPGLVEHVIEGS